MRTTVYIDDKSVKITLTELEAKVFLNQIGLWKFDRETIEIYRTRNEIRDGFNRLKIDLEKRSERHE